MGADGARLLWQLSERALDAMAVLAGDDLRRTGSLRLAVDEDERSELAAELEALRDDGFDAGWLDRLSPPLDRLFVAALVHPHDGAIHPARWVRRLAGKAVDTGVEIVEGSRVDLVELGAEAIVIATDGLTSDLLPEVRRTVVPVRGQMLATAPLASRLFDRPHYARHGFDYWQQLPDGRLVVGGKRDLAFETEFTDVDGTTPLVQGALEVFAAELVGGILPAVTHRWAGIWGETPDSRPLAGPVPGRPGVWVAGGYSGHGNVLGFACGELVARAVAGESAPELALFDPARFAGSHAA
jgi:glycine/D-amino acid oxidase-like deaminating enzyme